MSDELIKGLAKMAVTGHMSGIHTPFRPIGTSVGAFAGAALSPRGEKLRGTLEGGLAGAGVDAGFHFAQAPARAFSNFISSKFPTSVDPGWYGLPVEAAGGILGGLAINKALRAFKKPRGEKDER